MFFTLSACLFFLLYIDYGKILKRILITQSLSL